MLKNKRILTVAFLAMCLMGFSVSAVSAKQNDFTWNFDVGFTAEGFSHGHPSVMLDEKLYPEFDDFQWTTCAPSYNVFQYLVDHGIATQRRINCDYDEYHIFKAWSGTVKEDHWCWLDADYYHINICQPLTLNLSVGDTIEFEGNINNVTNFHIQSFNNKSYHWENYTAGTDYPQAFSIDKIFKAAGNSGIMRVHPFGESYYAFDCVEAVKSGHFDVIIPESLLHVYVNVQ